MRTMLRFTILVHHRGNRDAADNLVDSQESISEWLNSSPVHWDWLFQMESTSEARLWTWSTLPLVAPDANGMVQLPRLTLPAWRRADHRPIYLDYEGPVSAGRGEVDQLATGRYKQICVTPDRFEVAMFFTHSKFIAVESDISVQFRQCEDTSMGSDSEWGLVVSDGSSAGAGSSKASL